MKRIDVEIRAISPLAIGRNKPGGNVSEVETYIPGSVIRGMIASQILKQASTSVTDGDDFHALFLSSKPAIFQNAYPANIEIDDYIITKYDIRVLPATVLSSKIKSGFKSDESYKDGVFDTLIDRFCAEKYGQVYDPNCPTRLSTHGERVDKFSGFYSDINGEYYSLSAPTRILTRVGINRRRATSEERVLYSIEVLNESQKYKEKAVTYTGRIFMADKLAKSLQKFINSHPEDLRLGGSTSRGLGKVKIEAKPPVNFQSAAINNIREFNTKLRQRWGQWQEIFGDPLEELPENRTYFTLDLQADAILSENWQRTTVISPEMLKQVTEVSDTSLELHAAYSSYDYRSGWNSAWGLMKDVELITNQGAVYLFSTAHTDKWSNAWEDLEFQGIGARTSEGFGSVQICNDFHLILREEAV